MRSTGSRAPPGPAEDELLDDIAVMNQGSRRVAAGVSVTLYADGAAVATQQTSQPLLPGEREAM